MAHFDIVSGESEVLVSATTSLHPVTLTTSDVVGELDIETTPTGVFLAVAPSCRIELRVDSLHSGNAFYDREGKRRFDARHHPLVTAQLVTAIPLGAGRHRVTWRLTFHGATHDIRGDLTARGVDDDSIVVEGDNAFDVRDWGVQPGGFLVIRVRPEARFAVRLLARRCANPVAAPEHADRDVRRVGVGA